METILHNILTEDKYLRTYRRSISFGQNIKKDLIPLLIHAKDDKTIELLVRVLVNLTIPIECLLSVDIISKTDFGRHTVFEINNLLVTTKAAFTDHRATRVIIEFLKKNMDVDQKARLSLEQCSNISNSLLLLRNILHIPEENCGQSPNYNSSTHAIQNQILWNIFSQGVDKVLIKLMIIPDAVSIFLMLYVCQSHNYVYEWSKTNYFLYLFHIFQVSVKLNVGSCFSDLVSCKTYQVTFGSLHFFPIFVYQFAFNILSLCILGTLFLVVFKTRDVCFVFFFHFRPLGA